MPLAEQAETVTVTVSDTDEELVSRNNPADELATDEGLSSDELELDETPQLPKADRQPSPQ